MSLSFPKWMLPAVATLAIVGGGMAAAGALDGDEPVVDEPVPTTLEPTTTTLATVPADEEQSDEESSDESDSSDRYWNEEECGDGEPTNHGGYVSSAEKGGAARSEAAHSPCGKPLTSVESDDEGDDEDTEESDDEGTEEEEEVVPPTAGASSHGSGHGNGHGKG